MTVHRRMIALLAGIGLLGVASLAAMPIEALAPQEAPFSPPILRIIALLQPVILVLIAVFVGRWCAPPVALDAPLLRAVAERGSPWPVLARQWRPAVITAIPLGVVIAVYGFALQSFINSLGGGTAERLNAFAVPVVTRLLYGGLSEEIIVRWGLMSFVVWIVWRSSGRPRRVPDSAYWGGAAVSTLVFAIAHLPLFYALVASPPVWIIAMVTGANVLAGVGFAYLFWRWGLEAAMLSHGLSHLIAIAVPAVLGLS